MISRSKLLNNSFEGQKLTAFIPFDDIEASTKIKKLADDTDFNTFIVGGIKYACYLEVIVYFNIALGGGGTDDDFTYFKSKN